MSRYGEKCNVTACNEPHDNIPHADTGHLYCWLCAHKINRANEIYYKDDQDKLFAKSDIQAAEDRWREQT